MAMAATADVATHEQHTEVTGGVLMVRVGRGRSCHGSRGGWGRGQRTRGQGTQRSDGSTALDQNCCLLGLCISVVCLCRHWSSSLHKHRMALHLHRASPCTTPQPRGMCPFPYQIAVSHIASPSITPSPMLWCNVLYGVLDHG